MLAAFKLLNGNKYALVFLGDGEQRFEMENYVASNDVQDVYMVGFKNQSEVGKYFAATDIFVLPSGVGETWGLVVNEALNFNLSLIVSNVVGSGFDLVKEDINGYRFEYGNVEDLAVKIKLVGEKLSNDSVSIESQKLRTIYSNDTLVKGLIKLIND